MIYRERFPGRPRLGLFAARPKSRHIPPDRASSSVPYYAPAVSGDELETGGLEAEPEAPPPGIAELCQACSDYVTRATGVSPDFTPETLPLVDHYLGMVRESTEERPELLPLLARAVGAYFGEVVRRLLPSFWIIPSADAHEWRLCAVPVFLSLNPVGVAYDALHGTSEHDGPSSQLRLAPEEREVVDRRIAELPPVSEAEYFLLSTRIEVIEIAAEALRAQMLEGGSAGVEFDESDYAEGPQRLS